MATTKGSFEAAKASWGNPQPQSTRRSRSPPTTAAPSITVNNNAAAPTAAAPAAPAATSGYAQASASTARSKSPPLKERVAISPSPPVSPRNSRSFGADAYSVDYVKKTSNAVNLEVKDPNTECLRAVAESDVRCAVVTSNGAIWIGERSGDISIRKQDGELAHIIERRKGAFVMCFTEVGPTVWAGCSDGFIRVLSQTSFKMEAQFNRHSGSGSNVQTLAYHAPSNTVFSGSNDFQVLAWDATTCQFIRQLSGHSGGVRALAIDGNTLFSASDDTTIIAWDIATSQKVHQFTGHTKSVHCLAVTATHLWSGSEDATIRIWNPATGECIGIAEVHTGAVLTLQVIGDRVWSGAGDTVCMWDAVNLKLAGSATVHDGYVTNIINICRTPRFKVWTTGSDQLVKLWTTESPDDLPVLRHRINSLLHVDHENRQLKDANRQLQERVVTLSETVKRLEDAVHIREQHVDDVSRKLLAADVEAAHFVPETVRLREELAIRDLRIRELEISNAELADRLPVHAVPAKVHLVDELSAARAEVAALSDRLRATIDSYEAKLAIAAQTARAEEGARVAALLDEQHILQDTKLALRQDISRLTAEVERLYAELDHANAALKNTTALFEERVRELQAALADQKDRNTQLSAQNRKLEGDVNVLKDEVHARNLEIEKLQHKVRDMDNMFRSRLSLLTDFFGMYKKVETLDKRARATPAPPVSDVSRELNALAANYKRIVATHYTDDELAHLGTSRHFFPITGAGVPTSPPPAKPAATGTALPPEANPSPRLARRPPSA